MSDSSDLSVRAMTNDGSLRVIVVDVTQTVRAAAAAQRATGDDARWLGDLMAGTVMIRETMAPDLRVQGILQGVAAGTFVADSHPDGGTRGLLQRSAEGSAAPTVARLQMMRTLPRGGVQQGIVAVDPVGGVSDALMRYLQQSEQVTSALAVLTRVEGAEIVSAGGYLVQLLPELDEATLALMTARLQSLPSMEALLTSAASPDALVETLLADMPHTALSRDPQRFQCRCDRARLMQALATVGRDELDAMIAEGAPLQIACEYCAAEYVIAVAELQALIGRN